MIGKDQMTRKIIQGMRNAAPPFCAAIRGKRQRFPVPTAIPSPARITAQREENISGFNIQCPSLLWPSDALLAADLDQKS